MNFDKAFEIIVGHEGGLVDDPRDSGGLTKFGISKKSYPNLDIKSLTLSQAKSIYKRDFWDKCKCEQIKGELRLALFDMAVNQGPGTAIKTLQKALRVTVDGSIGPATIGAINKKSSEESQELLANFLAERVLLYTRTANFDVYGKGWVSRSFKIAMQSLG